MDRQYSYLAQQLLQLQDQLTVTSREISVMSKQCDQQIVGELGKIHSSWFIGTNQWLQNSLSNKK